MSIPSVDQTELDGALGVSSPSSGRLLAVLGTSSAGTVGSVATFANAKDALTALGYGPLTEAVCRHIDTQSLPVVAVKLAGTTVGAMGTIDDSGVTGTAVTFITHTSATEPFDDYEVVVKIIAGGTLGIAGITYQFSLDGGRNFSPTQALGTALILAIANSGVSFTITTAKTFVAGDVFKAPTTAPQPSASDVTDGITALKGSVVLWEEMHLANAMDATKFDNVETAFASLPGAGIFRFWCANTRVPNAGESEASYLTALTTAFVGVKTTVIGCLCAGAAFCVSSIPGRANKYRRPASFGVSCRLAGTAPHLDVADVGQGALTGMSLRDDLGNQVAGLHDEFMNPGLDDGRFTTLRTWPRRGGVYVTNPRIFSAPGSDFDLVQLRRVMNLAREASYDALQERLNKSVLVSRKTGYILEKEALEIEAFVTGRIGAAIGQEPMASGWNFVLSRTDNILSTKTLHGEARVVPLGYVKKIIERIGFTNPALSVVGV